MSTTKGKRQFISQDDLDQLDELATKRAMLQPGECKIHNDQTPVDKIKVIPRVEYPAETYREDYIADTPAALERFKDESRSQFRGHFSSESEFELFCMLPIAAHLRSEFIARAQEIRQGAM